MQRPLDMMDCVVDQRIAQRRIDEYSLKEYFVGDENTPEKLDIIRVFVDEIEDILRTRAGETPVRSASICMMARWELAAPGPDPPPAAKGMDMESVDTAPSAFFPTGIGK